jgi:hypothetical protein
VRKGSIRKIGNTSTTILQGASHSILDSSSAFGLPFARREEAEKGAGEKGAGGRRRKQGGERRRIASL